MSSRRRPARASRRKLCERLDGRRSDATHLAGGPRSPGFRGRWRERCGSRVSPRYPEELPGRVHLEEHQAPQRLDEVEAGEARPKRGIRRRSGPERLRPRRTVVPNLVGSPPQRHARKSMRVSAPPCEWMGSRRAPVDVVIADVGVFSHSAETSPARWAGAIRRVLLRVRRICVSTALRASRGRRSSPGAAARRPHERGAISSDSRRPRRALLAATGVEQALRASVRAEGNRARIRVVSRRACREVEARIVGDTSCLDLVQFRSASGHSSRAVDAL